MSANLNPMYEIRLRKLEEPPTNVQQLKAALHRIWWKIPQVSIRVYINMRARLQQVIRR